MASKRDLVYGTFIAVCLILLAGLLFIRPTPDSEAFTEAELFPEMIELLPGVAVEYPGNDSCIVFHTRRQLLFDKSELLDFHGENLPDSLKPFRDDLWSIAGVEKVDMYSYAFTLHKADLFTREEIAEDVKQLIALQWPMFIVKEKED